MALTDQLVAWYAMEENFDEAISAVNSVPPHAAPLATVNSPGGGTGTLFTKSVPGKIGNAAQGIEAISSVALEAVEHSINILNTDKTFAFWCRLTSDRADEIIFKGDTSTEYHFIFDNPTFKWSLRSQTQVLDYSVQPVVGQWYFIVFWFDLSASTAYMQVNAGAVESGAFTVALQPGTTFLAVNGAVEVDELGIWNRIITASEITQLYNNGEGLTYSDFSEVQTAVAVPCRGITCCPDDPYDYVSATGEGKGFDSACTPAATVEFEPTSGATLIMPSLLILRSNRTDAVIRYTLDGSEPNENSTIYTAPLTMDNPGTVVRARAFVAGCDPGGISSASYGQWAPAANFTFSCTTTDRAGQWGQFFLNGEPDYMWVLDIQLTAVTSVRQFDVYQLDSEGKFTTGVMYSSKEFHYPFDDPEIRYRAMPLVVYFGGGGQISGSYADDFSGSFGTFGIGSITLEMSGQPWIAAPTTNYFKFVLTFSDGTSIWSVVDTTCDALPPALCPVPTLSLVPVCGPPLRIDLTFSLGVGTPYSIVRRVQGGDWVTLVSGNVASSPETYQDNTVLAGVTYDYVIANLPASCVAQRHSQVYSATAISDPAVSISANPATIDPLGSSTLSWNSSNITGNVTISPTVGVKPGNVAGSESVSPAATQVYTITGDNVCGTQAQAQVTVTVNPVASCGAVQPDLVIIVGYSSVLFGSGGCTFRTGGIVAWNGMFAHETGCTFLPPESPVGPVPYHFGSSDGVNNREMHLTNTKITQGGGLWTLEVAGYDTVLGASLIVWRGTKVVGDTPVGTYSRTTGCSSIPVTVTVAEV